MWCQICLSNAVLAPELIDKFSRQLFHVTLGRLLPNCSNHNSWLFSKCPVILQLLWADFSLLVFVWFWVFFLVGIWLCFSLSECEYLNYTIKNNDLESNYFIKCLTWHQDAFKWRNLQKIKKWFPMLWYFFQNIVLFLICKCAKLQWLFNK